MLTYKYTTHSENKGPIVLIILPVRWFIPTQKIKKVNQNIKAFKNDLKKSR